MGRLVAPREMLEGFMIFGQARGGRFLRREPGKPRFRVGWPRLPASPAEPPTAGTRPSPSPPPAFHAENTAIHLLRSGDAGE